MTVRVCSFLVIGIAALNCIVMLSARNVLGIPFTDDPEVLKTVARLLIVNAVFQLPDAWQALLSGVLRGCGRQRVGAYVNFVGYYIVALPVGATLAFKAGLGSLGLWIGMTCGLTTTSTINYIIVSRSNWEHQVGGVGFGSPLGDWALWCLS